MSTSATPMPNLPTQPEPGLTEGQRIINTFVAPSKTFTDLKRKAGWFVPWLVISIVGLALTWVVAEKVGFEQVNENNIRMNARAQERLEKLTPEQRQQQRTIGATITKGFAIGWPLLRLLGYAIFAGLLLATFNFGLATEVNFGLALAVVAYAHLTEIVRALLAIISIFAGNTEGFIFQNPVASNLGALVDMAAHPALFALGSAIDIFSIWTIVLIGIGFACVTRLKRSTTLAVAFGWYAVFTLIGVGFAAAFS